MARLLLFVALALAVFVPVAHAGSCANAGTTWCGDFDTAPVVPNGQYTEVLGSPDRITFPSAPTLGGAGHSDRTELDVGDTWTDGTNRMQLRKGGTQWGEGVSVYFHVAVYIDPSMQIVGTGSNPWRAIFSWPVSENGSCSVGGFGLEGVDASNHVSASGTPSFDIQGDNGNCGASDVMYWKFSNPAKGKWFQFIEHRVESSNPNVGLIELWMKRPADTSYVRQTFLDGSTTLHVATLGVGTVNGHANMRIGLYRNPAAFSTTDVIYFDDVRAASTLAGAKMRGR